MTKISLQHKEVFWDFDGTLFDSYPVSIEAIQKVLYQYNIKISDEKLYENMMTTMSQALRDLVSAYPNTCTMDEFNQALAHVDPSRFQLYPHVQEVLEMIVQTGGHNYLLTHRGHSAIKAIQYKQMESLFTYCVTSESGYPRKPDPTSVLDIADKFHFSLEDAVIIGDRQLETDLAKNAGVTSIWYASNPSVTIHGADIRIDNYLELL